MKFVNLLNEEGARGRANDAPSLAFQALNVLTHLSWENEHLFHLVVSERLRKTHAGLAFESVIVDVLESACCLLEGAFNDASSPSEG